MPNMPGNQETSIHRQSCLWLVTIIVFILLGDSAAFAPSAIPPTLPLPSQIHFRKIHNTQNMMKRGHQKSLSMGLIEENALNRATKVPAFLFTLNASTKWVVALAHTIAVWSRPQTFIAPFIVTGSIAAVYFTGGLKKIINQGRPEGAPFTDPGMPSSHSLVSFFAAVAWVSVLESYAGSNIGKALLMGAASMIAILRVLCGYHSLAQIAVGAGLGSILGQIWVLLGHTLHSHNPRLALISSYACYLGGSIFFINKNMREWVAKDKLL